MNDTVTPRDAASGAADIPAPAVTRLATYLHILRSFSERGVVVTSSSQLATAAGVNSAILRKDLSYVGANGVRGVGYDVGRLTARISLALHTDSTETVVLAGAGRLGRALLEHTGFGRGFRVAALFDDDPAFIGTRIIDDGPVVSTIDDIEQVCIQLAPVQIGVIAIADGDAQRVADAFVAADVRQILNVTPTTLLVGSDVVVRQVDLALEMQVLAFAASRTPMRGADGEPTRGDEPTGTGEETVTA